MMLAVAVGLLTPVAARADDKTPITRFHATVELDEDGDADVTLDFTMDFSQVRGRGPIIVLPTRQAAGDRNDLLFDYVGFLWTSPTGADVTVHREDEARTIAMRVGRGARPRPDRGRLLPSRPHARRPVRSDALRNGRDLLVPRPRTPRGVPGDGELSQRHLPRRGCESG